MLFVHELLRKQNSKSLGEKYFELPFALTESVKLMRSMEYQRNRRRRKRVRRRSWRSS